MCVPSYVEHKDIRADANFILEPMIKDTTGKVWKWACTAVIGGYGVLSQISYIYIYPHSAWL